MAVWMKIVDDIVESIRNGEYAVDGQLASENKLTKIYSSTRHDVRKAYERLTEMGYVYSKQGKGHYYKSKHDRIELLLEGDTSFTEKNGKK
ncbi:MAG: GntR family transcriptional regulator [Clostridiales bacterium]|nr:GntR family transcriptional regulator [Clostridiales bacterium]